MFAAGHGEAGNDIPVLLSSSKAERVDGGWEFTGHKIFGSLSPVWTYLGIHGMDTSDPDNPQVVHGFLHRDAANYRIEETWDTLGHAGDDVATTRSSTAPSSPTRRSILVCPAGFAGAGMFHVALFAWALLGFAGVYALDRPPGVRRHRRPGAPAHVDRPDPVDGVPPRGAAPRRRDAHPPRGADAHLDRVCDDWSNGVDHGMDWPAKIVACKYDVVNRAWAVVDTRPRPHRRRRHLQAQPLRAAVPRRPPRPHPPGQLAAHPRARRQAQPRHQPRRTTPLGLRDLALTTMRIAQRS